ncbi:signal peptide peptidase SppA [Aureibaculum sp. 2210JD6-5]|uniref:signal peptide peptidase SppA n=1 Tax=Aureibaculum sp. 2210JD6-5 TaxID=3103957 RepID=UPI002AAD6CA4|nr:signal peptide peptidase SppA [Aureibaculum sp. 2210JD6-5]MDY7396272.1 signal peptide peptidase SppA [Aureibaculum sp. 2210JD6-5]
MKFLRELLAAILGVFIAMTIMFVVLMIFISVSASSFSDDKKVSVKNNTVLELNLESLIKDYAPKSDDPFAEIFDMDEGVLGLQEILNAIENAKTDDNIKGISINTLFVNAGKAQTQAIRDKLVNFKESGKFIMAYADFYLQDNFYLSSVADSVFVNPVGEIDFRGLSTEILYYKDLQEKSGVKMEVIRHGKYKSAVEPFLANNMSDANRIQISSFLNSIWDEMVTDIAESKKKTAEEINTIADSLSARTPEMAIKKNMIDGQLFHDEYNDKLKSLSGIEQDKELSKVTIADYISTGKGRIKSTASDKIAVIYAQGEIMYGEGSLDVIGQEKIIEALKKTREDDKIKAIVLRVNSPGGSALASDIIWRELELTKKEKPLVVSMGNYAASGGYYIACNADEIFAEPTTITGSIGVFGIIPNFSKLTEDIGINAEQVGTNKNSFAYSPFEPMTESFYNVAKEGVEGIYKTFVSRVADGRNMTEAEVDSIAQGRVWSGVEALENGLVDKLGNLDDAVGRAAELAEISDYGITNYPRYKTDFKDAFNPISFIKASKESVLKEELGIENYQIYKNIKYFANLKGVQARMPFELKIK